MKESEFNQLAEQAMIDIEEAIESSGADIDYDTAGDVLTLEFANRSQIIVNKQAPLCQLWVAAKSGGYHFDYDADHGVWCLNGNPAHHLFERLGVYCSEQAGEPVNLEPPDR